jgi:two-component system chemotaxis response regulator CheV
MKLSDDFEILLFKLQNGQKYGIDILKIKEIINFSKINKIPNSKKNIEGFISLRDETVAVINTDKSISVINDQK